MSYIGVQPKAGQYRKLDDISGGFNGGTATFNLTVSNQAVTAATAQQLMISLGGVIQNPGVDYTVSTNTITFTTNPASGLDFFGVLLGDAINTGTPSDGTVTTAKLAADLSVDLASGSAGTPSLTFDANSGLFSPANDEISISTNGGERFRVGSAGQLGIGGATYGTSGQVLTSGGTSAAPSWADSSGITWLTTVDATADSGSAKTIDSIDTNARMIVIAMYRVSQSGSSTNPVSLRVGNGSINSGNNYYWSVARGVDSDSISTATNFYRLIVDAYSGTGQIFSGTVTLLRAQDSSNPLWSFSHLLSENGGGNEPIYGAGSFTDTLIDRVQLIPGTTFDSGILRVGYIK